MANRISVRMKEGLIRDILHAEHDMISLAKKYKLSPERLSQWIRESDNHQTLTGLCVIADIQTQLLLSRYRLVAAGRLIKLATDEGGGDDVIRRSCVDLLKLDLKGAQEERGVGDFDEGLVEVEGMASLREKLYATKK